MLAEGCFLLRALDLVNMNLENIRKYQIPSINHAYDSKDAILYALGLGFGSNPLDEDQVSFVYEDGLQIVPSMANTIAHPGFWIRQPELGIDWVKVLHAEQAFDIHIPLPTKAQMRGIYEIVSVEDKGAEKGAIMTMAKRLVDVDSAAHYATVTQTIFLRGDGGQGGFGTPPISATPIPERLPDASIDIQTLPQLALIYRLSGDMNPIHASPSLAQKAGFDRPILHGLCTMGLATRAIIQGVCDYRPERLRSMFVRFSKPVFPGETIRTEVFNESNGSVRFRCISLEREIVVIDRGHAQISN
jgi:acyl dehydratase